MGGIDNRELMKLAEPYKSFPQAVAAVVRAMFDQGTNEVKIVFDGELLAGSIIDVLGTLTVFDETLGIRGLLRKFSKEPKLAWTLAFIHHSESVCVDNSGYRFSGVGLGDGVNPKQDRSARRLLRELPKFLSPREAFHTRIIDERGQEHELVKALPGTSTDGFRVEWPVRMVGYSLEGLLLKFGTVMVPMRVFLDHVRGLGADYHRRLDILTHPWLVGVVEVRPDETVGITAPTQPGVDFDDTFYTSGQAKMLAMALLESNVYLVAQDEIGKVIEQALGDVTNQSGELAFRFRCFRVSRLPPGTLLEEPGAPLLWRNKHSPEGVDELFIDVTHPVFRSIASEHEVIMQVIWWQIAMWIAVNQLEVFQEELDLLTRIMRIYLLMRWQNREHLDD